MGGKIAYCINGIIRRIDHIGAAVDIGIFEFYGVAANQVGCGICLPVNAPIQFAVGGKIEIVAGFANII